MPKKPQTKQVSQVDSKLAKNCDQYSPFLPHFSLKDCETHYP